MRSQNAREPPPGAGIAHTRTFASFSINAGEDLEARAAEVLGHVGISMGLRRSGLSVPYLRIASS